VVGGTAGRRGAREEVRGEWVGGEGRVGQLRPLLTFSCCPNGGGYFGLSLRIQGSHRQNAQ
jgi:hypothetical protein